MNSLMMLLTALPLCVGAEVIRLYATSQTTLTLPGKPGSTVMCKPAEADCDWSTVSYETADNGLKMTLQPPADGKELLLLVNPEKGWDINDRNPPALKSLLVNGKPAIIKKGVVNLPDDLIVDTIAWQAEDAENTLDSARSAFLLDDAPVKCSLDGKKAEGTLKIEQKVMGSHVVKLRLVDSAPEANALEVTLHFKYADKNNLLNPQAGLERISVDSCYDGYSSLTPLNDGVLKLPGASAGGDVTWASAETPTDHWVRMDFKKEVTVKEAYFFWPRLENSSKIFEFQVLQGDKWVRLEGTPDGGQKETLTTAFILKSPAKGNAFRLWQPKGGGPMGRKDILWLCEIVLK